MSFLKKLEDFFFAEDPPLEGEPITWQGKVFVPYRKENDQYVQWPNATCPICGGLQLKKKLYYNKESETYCHKECLLKQ